MADTLSVSLELTANRPVSELPSSDQLRRVLESSMESITSELRSGRDLASALSLPDQVPIVFAVHVVGPANDKPSKTIPLKVSLTGFPETLSKVRVIEEKLNDLVFSRIRHIKAPEDLATALGYDKPHGAEFTLAFDEQIPEVLSPSRLVEAAGCAPGSQFSWGKGCNSWPW